MCVVCHWNGRTVWLMKNLNFILYSSVLKTLKMKNTKKRLYFCINILNSKIIVILTGCIARESNGGDALLLYFLLLWFIVYSVLDVYCVT